MICVKYVFCFLTFTGPDYLSHSSEFEENLFLNRSSYLESGLKLAFS